MKCSIGSVGAAMEEWKESKNAWREINGNINGKGRQAMLMKVKKDEKPQPLAGKG
jgi:hypothetical protein